MPATKKTASKKPVRAVKAKAPIKAAKVAPAKKKTVAVTAPKSVVRRAKADDSEKRLLLLVCVWLGLITIFLLMVLLKRY